MVFHYSRVVPKHKAGVIAVGHHVTSNMLIPPQAGTYEVDGYCHGNCTKLVSQLFVVKMRGGGGG